MVAIWLIFFMSTRPLSTTTKIKTSRMPQVLQELIGYETIFHWNKDYDQAKKHIVAPEACTYEIIVHYNKY